MVSTSIYSKRWLLVLMVLILSLVLQACATNRKPRRGRLSHAMDKASDKNKGSRVIEAPDHSDDPFHRPYPPPHIDDRAAIEDRAETEQNPPIKQEKHIPGIPESARDTAPEEDSAVSPFGLTAGVGLLKSEDFSELINLEISLGDTGKQSRTEIYLGAGWAGVDLTSDLNDAIENGIWIFSLGMNYKYKISEMPGWSTPYLMFGAAYKQMSWEYKNEIFTTTGDTIHGDRLEGIELHAGFGKNFITLNQGTIGIEVVPAVIFWYSQTREGFDNDVFDPFLMLNIRAVFSTW